MRKHELIKGYAEQLNDKIEMLNDLLEDIDEIDDDEFLSYICQDLDKANDDVRHACASVKWAYSEKYEH